MSAYKLIPIFCCTCLSILVLIIKTLPTTKLIKQLDNQIKNKRKRPTNDPLTLNNNKKWIIFGYHSPSIRKVTNILRNTHLKIAYRVSNTIKNVLNSYTQNYDKYTNRGLYSLKCNTCNRYYVGQTGGSLRARFTEHNRYIKSNDPKSAYALHILNNQHEYNTIQNTMELIKPCKKGWHMNVTENLYIQLYHQQQLLIAEQSPAHENPLFRFLSLPPHPPNNT